MKRSLFAQLFTLFLIISFVVVAGVGTLFYFTLRNERFSARLEELRIEAEDLSYLAETLQNESYYRLSSSSSNATREFLYQKSDRVYSRFQTLTLIVSRDGSANAYYRDDALLSQSLSFTPRLEELYSYISRTTQDEKTISTTTKTASGSYYTTIVPWTQTNSLSSVTTVMGVVILQTPASVIQASYIRLLLEILLIAVFAYLLAALFSYLAAKHFTIPLTGVYSASNRFMKGDFSQKAPEAGSSDVKKLGVNMNHLAEQLSTSEQSKKEFIANLSHEFRSPITSIHGFAQAMLDGTVPKDEEKKYLNVIVSETNRLSKLINNMLNLSRMEQKDISLALSDFDINEMVRRTIISKIPQLEEKELELEPVFETESCYVRADPEQIQQVLINLMDNAIKYTPEHGSITITTELKDETVYLHVKDNGIGILPSDARHIFDRFYKADKAHTVGKGTGLGLAICKIIMEKHNQSIRLVSGEHGSDFEITLQKGERPDNRNAKHDS